jgi:catechol 2,3-dioxygenase-like lactoylglutathione lyase family enzyme
MTHVRVARPVSDLGRAREMYCRGLGLRVLGSFQDHEGFDGVILGVPGGGMHFELTRCTAHPVAPSPSPEDLAVFYIPSAAGWRRACDDMLAAGFRRVASFNPYWERRGRTFEDPDGYRIVLQNARWQNV